MPKPSVRALPEFGHAFGLPGARDQEGVAARKYLFSNNVVTTVWTAHSSSKLPRYEKNFRATNKMSLNKKATTSRAQSAYRRTTG